MNEQVLNNIHKVLRKNSATNNNYDTWRNNFLDNTDVQANVHSYLRTKKLVTSNFDNWMYTVATDPVDLSGREQKNSGSPFSQKVESNKKVGVISGQEQEGDYDYKFGETWSYDELTSAGKTHVYQSNSGKRYVKYNGQWYLKSDIIDENTKKCWWRPAAGCHYITHTS